MKYKKRICCKRKVKHKSWSNARIALKELQKIGFIGRVYKCRKCGFYHVGKPSYYDSPRDFWHNIINKSKRTGIEL